MVNAEAPVAVAFGEIEVTVAPPRTTFAGVITPAREILIPKDDEAVDSDFWDVL